MGFVRNERESLEAVFLALTRLLRDDGAHERDTRSGVCTCVCLRMYVMRYECFFVRLCVRVCVCMVVREQTKQKKKNQKKILEKKKIRNDSFYDLGIRGSLSRMQIETILG